jgi:microcystin-dependent protein
MDAWLTPDTPASGFICRRLLIPNSVEFLAIVKGALLPLIYTRNFESFGTLTPAQTAAYFQDMFADFSRATDRTCRMIGELIPYAGSTLPDPNWLFCDGASLLRADYPDLFAVVGTAYGAVDGSHFNLPDMRGRTALGSGTGSGLSTRVLGDSFGEEAHTLTIAELAAHTHTDSGHTHVEGTAAPAVGAAIVGVPIPSAVPAAGVTGSG